MKNKTLVSVITPCYNQEDYLEKTIMSVLESTYRPLEMLIIDDGSTDKSSEIAKRWAFQNPNIRYIRQENAGPSAARNKGIHSAKGEYIFPLDADDLISNDYVEKAVNILDQDKTVKVVYCEARKFGGRNEKWKLPAFSRPLLARKNMIFVSAMYRKENWVEINGYAEEMTWGFEDWEFWISMLKTGGKVVKLPIIGFFYRIRNSSRRKSVTPQGRHLTIKFINKKHREFIFKHLHGPLRENKTLSKPINRFLKLVGYKLTRKSKFYLF